MHALLTLEKVSKFPCLGMETWKLLGAWQRMA